MITKKVPLKKVKVCFYCLNKEVIWGTNLMKNLKGKLARNY